MPGEEVVIDQQATFGREGAYRSSQRRQRVRRPTIPTAFASGSWYQQVSMRQWTVIVGHCGRLCAHISSRQLKFTIRG